MQAKSILILSTLLALCGCLSVSNKPSQLILNRASDNQVTSEYFDPNREYQGATPTIGDRWFISNVLLDIFGPSAHQVVRENVIWVPESFGGGCDLYEMSKIDYSNWEFLDSYCPNLSTGIALKQPAIKASSTVREGWLIRTCELLVKNPSAMTYAVQRVKQVTQDASANIAINANTISAAYHLFNPYRTPASEVVDKVLEFNNSNSSSIEEKMQILILTLCIDPTWQMY